MKCFLISPIGEEGSDVRQHADDVFRYIIEPAMKECEIEAIRSDQLDKPGLISEQMFRFIFEADLCIAVLTNHNPNVFYELAVAHSAKRPVIILIEKGQQLPFDVSGLRAIKYDLGIRSYEAKTYIDKVVNYVKAFKTEEWKTTDIFSAFRPSLDVGAGLDLTRVKESNGVLWTTVGGCEIRVINGRIEEQTGKAGIAIALPCNEYFDDRCVGDTGSALGAYVNRVFDGQVAEFISLMKDECRKKLGAGVEQQKTDDERAESFGAGRCVLLRAPLARSVQIALVSTTTQRANQGLAARISYLFNGMHELVTRLANARLNEVVMPILGAGHGGIDPPLAFVGLLLAVAEAARYGQGGQHLKRVTIVVFKPDGENPPAVDQVIVRRALALIGTGK
jgi:hypothetical protein